jgi:hypothetical protein
VLQQTTAQRTANTKGSVIVESSGILISQNIRTATGDTCGGAVTTTELESSVTSGKDLGIADPTPVSVILNGPIASGDLLANHAQTSGGSSKSYSQAPSPRGSYVIPVSPSSPAPGVYNKNNQVTVFVIIHFHCNITVLIAIILLHVNFLFLLRLLVKRTLLQVGSLFLHPVFLLVNLFFFTNHDIYTIPVFLVRCFNSDVSSYGISKTGIELTLFTL